MTHSEYSARARTVVHCHPAHLTFGGRCLNCGYDPLLHGAITPPPMKYVLRHEKYGYYKGNNLYLGSAMITDGFETAARLTSEEAVRTLNAFHDRNGWEVIPA